MGVIIFANKSKFAGKSYNYVRYEYILRRACGGGGGAPAQGRREATGKKGHGRKSVARCSVAPTAE